MLDIKKASKLRIYLATAAVTMAAAAGVALVTLDKDDPAGPSPAPGPGLAGCVENYDLSTLATREVAFVGTVRTVEKDTITFDVDEWFTGGTSGKIALGGATGLGGFTSSGSALPLNSGSKLLVSGDGGFAWGCGFTQVFDEGVATDWRNTFA